MLNEIFLPPGFLAQTQYLSVRYHHAVADNHRAAVLEFVHSVPQRHYAPVRPVVGRLVGGDVHLDTAAVIELTVPALGGDGGGQQANQKSEGKLTIRITFEHSGSLLQP